MLMRDQISKAVATVFFIGTIKKAPGTFGSLPAFPICYMIVYFVQNNKLLFDIEGLNIELQYFINAFTIGMVVTLLLFIIGIIATSIYIKNLPDKDPKEVVIDELVGQMLVILLTAVSIYFIQNSAIPTKLSGTTIDAIFLFLLPFTLFRLFDIFKPWPINWLDNNIKGALGVMLDDIAAAIFAVVMHFTIVFILIDLFPL